jgi:peroxiredoxin
MANNLTGDYEAVVQVSTRQINGLLATLHQNGAQESAPLKLLHSSTFRVGDRKPGHGDVVRGDFADWVNAYQMARGPVGLGDLRKHLAGFAPPGAAKMIEAEFSKFGQVRPPPPPPPETVRGTVKVQLASPTLSLTAGSTSEVTVHVGVRAHYYPDPGTTDMPKPVHGEVQAAFEVRQASPLVFEMSRSREERAVHPPPGVFRRRLLIEPSSDDNKIQFITALGTGLSAADVDKISAQVRQAVRESFTVLPVDLPTGFPFTDFKGLGSGPGAAIALPVQLSGAALPAGAIQSINNLFIGPAGFAVAVGREFIQSQFKPTLDKLKEFKTDIPISFGLGSVTYHVSVTDADIVASQGSFDLVVKAKATNPHLPDFSNIVIKQRLTLVLFLDTLFISALDQDPDLTISGLSISLGLGSISLPTGDVRSAIIAERNRQLPPAQDQLNTVLRDARTRLNNALHSFDPAVSASFRAGTSEDSGAASSGAIAITPDGVILRGDIGSGAARYAPIVSIAETDQGSAFTALESWIPGGRIDRLIWSWVEYANPSIFSGIQKPFTDEHRFIFPKPPGITELSSICLRIEGTQTLPDGSVVSTAGGTTCLVPFPGQVMEAPSWFEPVTVPVWMPGSNEGAILRELIRGHVSVQADTPLGNELTHNCLIYFANWRAEKPLDTLVRAVDHVLRKSYSLVVTVVLPDGTFDSRRREVEAELSSAWERFRGRLLLTEDNEGGWTRTFATGKLPSAYLINAKREFVWKHEGESDPKELAAALDKHLLPAPMPRSRGLRLAVSPGDRAPDAFFEDDRGQQFALHRMRGREILLNFWQSWSAPSIKELIRLQRLQKEAGGRAPFIVAFHGGKDRKVIAEIRKQHELTFPLAQDTDQRIARVYGVKCWPTTISVNADGLIRHVQFGVAHEHMAEGSAQSARDIAT